MRDLGSRKSRGRAPATSSQRRCGSFTPAEMLEVEGELDLKCHDIQALAIACVLSSILGGELLVVVRVKSLTTFSSLPRAAQDDCHAGWMPEANSKAREIAENLGGLWIAEVSGHRAAQGDVANSTPQPHSGDWPPRRARRKLRAQSADRNHLQSKRKEFGGQSAKVVTFIVLNWSHAAQARGLWPTRIQETCGAASGGCTGLAAMCTSPCACALQPRLTAAHTHTGWLAHKPSEWGFHGTSAWEVLLQAGSSQVETELTLA